MNEKNLQRIPLEDRLKRKKGLDANFLSIFTVFADNYYEAVTRITGDRYFEDIYKSEIQAMGFEKEPVMSELISKLEKLPKEQKMRKLYYILIEPFLSLNPSKFERSMENNE